MSRLIGMREKIFSPINEAGVLACGNPISITHSVGKTF
jgi:hypothetical protein